MTRIIGITSGKGGVGKTTTAVNLGTSLTALGRSVIVVDANLSTPNIGLHLGMPLSSVSLHDVLSDNAYITEAISIHPPSGLRVVPAGLSIENLARTNYHKLESAIVDLLGYADFVIVDCPAGLDEGSIKVIQACDEILLVTNPEIPAVTDALKAKKVAEASSHILGIVLNKCRGAKSELTPDEIEQIIEAPVIVTIPHDTDVIEAIASKNPVVDFAPASPASREWNRLAHLIVGLEFTEELPDNPKLLKRLVRKILRKS